MGLTADNKRFGFIWFYSEHVHCAILLIIQLKRRNRQCALMRNCVCSVYRWLTPSMVMIFRIYFSVYHLWFNRYLFIKRITRHYSSLHLGLLCCCPLSLCSKNKNRPIIKISHCLRMHIDIVTKKNTKTCSNSLIKLSANLYKKNRSRHVTIFNIYVRFHTLLG